MANGMPQADPDAEPPRHRPLVPVLAGFALGIALDGWFCLGLWQWAALGLALVPAVLWGVRRGLRPWGHWALALVMLVSLGGFWHTVRFRAKAPWHLRNLALKGEAFYYVRGRVADVPQARVRLPAFPTQESAAEAYWVVRVEAEGLSGDRKAWRRVSGGMAVFVRAGEPALNVGDEVEFLARPRGNRPAGNPGERDLALAAERYGSFATASVDSPEAFVVLRRSHWYGSVPAAVGRLRAYVQAGLRGRLRRGGSEETYGLVAALLTGERRALTPAQETLLKESGTLHFLAISGLHVGIFYLFVEVLLALLALPVRARAVVALALVWLYVAFTGLNVSAVRAGWMLSFLLAAPLLERQRDSYSALAGAALMILLVSPQELFAAGFQLTFAAVWAIICVYPQVARSVWPWEDMLARLRQPTEAGMARILWGWARSYLLLSVVIWVATAPLLAYHFNSLCIFAPLLNLLMWPLVLLLLLSCFLLPLALPLGAWVVAVPAWSAGFFSDQIVALLRLASLVPGFGVYMPSPALWWVGLFYVVLGAWAIRRRLSVGPKGFVAAAAALALAYGANEAVARLGRPFAVTIADVGSGQAALVQAPGSRAFLFDAGSSRQGAQQATAELLWHLRVGRLDAVALSHFDKDHCDFLPFLSRRFGIACVAVPPSAGYTPFGSQVAEWMQQAGLTVHALGERAEIRAGGLRCTVLHPEPRFTAASESENERSLVVRCDYAGLTLLLPGDIQSEAIRRLNAEYGDRLKADVLLMPHHGHYSPGLEDFVGHVRPVLAVVSGKEADCDTRTRVLLEAQGVPLWVTEAEGAVVIALRDGRARVQGFRSGRSMAFEPSGSLSAVAARQETE